MAYEIGPRIKKFREAMNLCQKDFAKMLGVSGSRVSNWELGINRPDVDILAAICRILKVSPGELLGVCAEKGVLSGPAERVGHAYDAAPRPVQKTVEVALEPYMETTAAYAVPLRGGMDAAEELVPETLAEFPFFAESAAAGLGNYLSGDTMQSTITVPADAIPGRATFAVRIRGGSMEPRFPDGSVVFVEGKPAIESGEIGVFLLNNEALCKKLEIDPRRNSLRLTSLNPDGPCFEVTGDDDLVTYGKVVGCWEEGASCRLCNC